MTRAQERAIARVCAHECLLGELVEALEAARKWHNGDKWRFDESEVMRQSWQDHADYLDEVLARAKEQAA